MRHLHTHRAAWLGRCLTWMLLLSAVLAGGTGWARALYLYSDSNASAAALDESHPGINSVLLNLETGKSGENAMLTAGTLVTVRRGGETITATAQAETVEQFLSRMDIIPGPLEMVGIELMEGSVALTISDHLTVYERVTEQAEHGTVYRSTPDLPKGQERVARKGVDGQHAAIYEQTWVSGQLVTSQYVEEITSTSVDEIVEQGTAVTSVDADDKVVNVTTNADGSGYLTFASGGTMKFSKAVQVTATAYTAGYDGVDHTTATGTFVHKGVAAVDKRVFPLGSDLYVMAKGMEYGLTKAEDTGMKGQKIDLYLESYQQCIQFGRRSATVYLLENS
ncbi:G5 and 3D domain-containing protein [Neopoerus faecalis]|uniref:G5 and 3D domain-containing protein n=1 Tax=Neopoerus faecalis TaxID=3032125 RepID=UPI0025702DBC|nr:G5 domain-containing protein [Neopoerus faecalis]